MPTPIPSTPFHLSTRHGSRRLAMEKVRSSNTEKESENAEFETEGISQDKKGENDEIPTSPTKKHMKRVKSVSDEQDEKNGGEKYPPIRKASTNPVRIDRILNKYLVSDANLMCTEILDQLSSNTDPSKLSGSTPQISIDWNNISLRIQEKHNLSFKPRECQELWKFLAYDRKPVSMNDSNESTDLQDEAMLPESDVEDFTMPTEALANKVTDDTDIPEDGESTSAKPISENMTEGEETKSISTGESTSLKVPMSQEPPPTPSTKESKFKPQKLELYPEYDGSGFLPSEAANDASHFAALHAVAEQFVKRRRVEIVPNPIPRLAPTSQTPQKEKQKTQPRNVFLNTAPPSEPVPPSSAFDTFRRMYIDRNSGDEGKIKQMFEIAPIEVRTKCYQMAAQDLERYQRECLRVRLYEKSARAVAAQAESTVPTPDTV